MKKWMITIIATSLWIVPTTSLSASLSEIKTYYSSADIAIRRMELNKAAEYLDKLTTPQNLKQIPKPQQQDIAEIAARAYLMSGNYQKTIRLKKYHQNYGLPHTLISLQAIQQENWRQALHSLEIAPVAEDNLTWQEWILPLLRIWALAGQGKAGQAFSHLDDLSNKQELREILPLQEILLHLHLRQPQAVLKKLKNYQTLPSPFLAYYLQALVMANRNEEAQEILRFAEDSDSEIFAEVRRAMQNDVDIEATLTPPSQAISYLFLQLAEILLTNHAREALVFARLASFIGEDNFETSYIIADAFARHNDYVSAIEVWQDFVAINNEQKISSALQMSEYLFQLQRYDNAEDLLLNLRKEFKDDIALRESLAFIYLRQESYDSVINFYANETLLADNSEHWRGFYLRGISYENLQMWDLAEADLLEAHNLAPDNPYVMNYLGYSWISRGENLQRGFHLLRRAVDLRNDNGAILDSLGWAYYLLGDYASSIMYLERAVVLSPDESVILDHLGDAYWQVGRRLEARFQWRRALRLSDMTEDLRDKILQKLESES